MPYGETSVPRVMNTYACTRIHVVAYIRRLRRLRRLVVAYVFGMGRPIVDERGRHSRNDDD